MLHRPRSKFLYLAPFLFILITLVSCTTQPQPTAPPVLTVVEGNTPETPSTPAASPTPQARVLTICALQEPSSLFIYIDQSQAARNVREAIYDGPVDMIDFQAAPVILSEIPDQASGGVVFESVAVAPGASIVDSQGGLVSLEQGVQYLPAGCREAGCAQIYQGEDSIPMDQLVVQFRLRPGLQWSDGAPLTADDSQYSYEIAREMYPRVRQNLIIHTALYQAQDAETIVWRGVPGYRDPAYATFIFQPLPRHAWGSFSVEELLVNENVNLTPLGWGPYTVTEWTRGDHITLSRNPLYWRAAEGLPYFDHLIFRFVPNQEEILAGLLAGECDLVDDTAGLETQAERLSQLQAEGRLLTAYQTGTAWEHLDFGIQPMAAAGETSASLFQSPQLRQAIATCIDRERLANELFFGISQAPDTYLPPSHPLANPDVKRYAYDPEAASALLDSAGWSDTDQDPATPRQAQGVVGVADGTPLVIELLTSDEAEKQTAALILQGNLAGCGIHLTVNALPLEELYAPGPEGPVFGRAFQLAQFNWSNSYEPPCFLYLSSEIPGPYPDFPRGWGGANASGYQNAEYDLACRTAMTSLSDDPQYTANHRRAQEIFANDLPAFPLYMRLKLVAARPDMCGYQVEAGSNSALWNLEAFNYGDACNP